MKINLVGINTCTTCSEVINIFKNKNIDFEYIDCDKNSDYCDKLEAITNTSKYPMILLYDHNNLSEIIYRTYEIHNFYENKNINNIVLSPYFTISDLLTCILNKINKQ